MTETATEPTAVRYDGDDARNRLATTPEEPMAPARKTETVTTTTGVKLPTGHRGAKVELPNRGRSATPSVYVEDAQWSLDESLAGRIETAWVAFQKVRSDQKQSLVNEWTKAARQIGCGLSKHESEHPDGTLDVAFRCQPKRERKNDKAA